MNKRSTKRKMEEHIKTKINKKNNNKNILSMI